MHKNFIHISLFLKFSYNYFGGLNNHFHHLRPPEDGGLNHRNSYRRILRINYCE
jgi:hypothetical protein